MEKVYTNGKQKIAGMATLTLDKIHFMSTPVTMDKGEYYVIIKRSIH